MCWKKPFDIKHADRKRTTKNIVEFLNGKDVIFKWNWNKSILNCTNTKVNEQYFTKRKKGYFDRNFALLPFARIYASQWKLWIPVVFYCEKKNIVTGSTRVKLHRFLLFFCADSKYSIKLRWKNSFQ